jgi:hypothetical protein
MNGQEAEQAMSLEQFIEETIAMLGTDADEILIDAAKPLRASVGPDERGLVSDFNAQMPEHFRPNAPIAGTTSGIGSHGDNAAVGILLH